MLYELSFAKLTINTPFTLFQCYPRVKVPISEEITINSLGIEGPLVVEHLNDSPDPLDYLQTLNAEVNFNE